MHTSIKRRKKMTHKICKYLITWVALRLIVIKEKYLATTHFVNQKNNNK